MHKEGTLIAEEADNETVIGVVCRLEGTQPVEVIPTIITAVVAPVNVVETSGIHSINIEGVTAYIHIMSCIDNRSSLLQFMTKNRVPTGGGIENAVCIFHHTISEGPLQGFDSPIDICARGIQAIVHVYRHSRRQAHPCDCQALRLGPSVAIVQQVVVPVKTSAWEHIFDSVVVCLPTEKGILQLLRIAIIRHHLLYGRGDAPAETARLADLSAILRPIGTKEVIRLLLVSDGMQQGAYRLVASCNLSFPLGPREYS